MTTEERMAAYDAMRAQQVTNVQAARGEHHHDEAADALVVEALLALVGVISSARWHHFKDCARLGLEKCAACIAEDKGRDALKAMGK